MSPPVCAACVPGSTALGNPDPARRGLRRRLPAPPHRGRRDPAHGARPRGRIPGHHPFPWRYQSRPFHSDLHAQRPQSAHLLDGPRRRTRQRRRPHHPLRFLSARQDLLAERSRAPPVPGHPRPGRSASQNHSRTGSERSLRRQIHRRAARLEVSKQAIVSQIAGEESQDRFRRRRAEAQSAGGHGGAARRFR